MKVSPLLLNHPTGAAQTVACPRPESFTPRRSFFGDLSQASLVRTQAWNALEPTTQEELRRLDDPERLLSRLVDYEVLTEYQARRIDAGKTFGLVLGNYRVLDAIGKGGMGIVFKGEHLRLPRQVALKVLSLYADHEQNQLQRFLAEVSTIAQLQHPNIVSAIDAGEVVSPDPALPDLHYFVTEYVPGQDLEDHVAAQGPLAPGESCDLVHQVAEALAAAHKQNLVHRDVKPSNVMVTPEGRAKLLDFGLARQFGSRLTEPGMVLGTLNYMSPEQARDASAVDARADVYGLGGTLFWCLTGRTPFQLEGRGIDAVLGRMTQAAPSARAWKPDIPAELDAVVSRMMALAPDDRFPSAEAAMRALAPFVKGQRAGSIIGPRGKADGERIDAADWGPAQARIQRILIVDDEADTRGFCRYALADQLTECDEAPSGVAALEALQAKPYDLVLSDMDMPQMTGPQLLCRLRQEPLYPHLKVILFSGRASPEEMAQMLSAGADDYLAKPISLVQLQSRVKAALRLKEAQDRSDSLNLHLLAANAELERNVADRDCDLVHARNTLVLALAELVAARDSETGSHLLRLQHYSRCLAEEAVRLPVFAAQIDANFIQMLACCAPLHDIGKVGVPDHILLKPGKLDADERLIMQTHTTVGAAMLEKAAKQGGFSTGFFRMAIEIVRHHHERYDGTGYPDRLAAEAIPLAARVVAFGDVYDALRSRRPYKPALTHAATVQLMTQSSAGQFDPVLMQAFQRCAARFEEIFGEVRD
jgi:response regulator RpfG family c-di-GMP phosphodiesterase